MVQAVVAVVAAAAIVVVQAVVAVVAAAADVLAIASAAAYANHRPLVTLFHTPNREHWSRCGPTSRRMTLRAR